MQAQDRKFIKKYKEKKFGIEQPVPQAAPQKAPQAAPKEAPQKAPQAAPKEAPQKAPQAAPKEAPQEAPQEAPKEVVKKDVQAAPKEAPQEVFQEVVQAAPQAAPKEVVKKDVQEVFQGVCKSLNSVSKTEDKTKENALRIIKNSLEQIQFALLLLEESVVPQEQPVEPASNVKQQIEPTVIVPQKVAATHTDYISDVEEEKEVIFPKKIQEEEFKIVMPKKSKAKKDEFPSLGSSFTPIKKTGFWGSGNSVEIAKSIAHIPSPKPIRVSSPSLTKKSAMVAKDGENDYSSDDDLSEYSIQKSKNDDYWE